MELPDYTEVTLKKIISTEPKGNVMGKKTRKMLQKFQKGNEVYWMNNPLRSGPSQMKLVYETVKYLIS